VIYLDVSLMLLPLVFLTVKVTLNFPALEYVCVGLRDEEVAPSPKFQIREIDDSVLLSTNDTFNGFFPDVTLAENAALGAFMAVGAFEVTTVM
jgi:hypothetical protein